MVWGSVWITHDRKAAADAVRAIRARFGAYAAVLDVRDDENHVRVPERLIDEASALLFGSNGVFTARRDTPARLR